MNELKTFHNRLSKIGIETKYEGNAPWIYFTEVNGIPVKGKYLGNHGFTAFWYTSKGTEITDITEVFKKIRETLNMNYGK
jgi:hypothetical protein